MALRTSCSGARRERRARFSSKRLTALWAWAAPTSPSSTRCGALLLLWTGWHAHSQLLTALLLQLAGEGVTEDLFSLCYGSIEGDGALMLGDVVLPPWTEQLAYSPMVQVGVLLSSLAWAGLALQVWQLDCPAFTHRQHRRHMLPDIRGRGA